MMVAFKINRPGVVPAAGGAKPARSPRRRVLLRGMFHSLTDSTRASVRNLSCTGAAIACDSPLRIGAEGVLQADEIDCLCRVIWQKGDVYGIQFDEPLPNAMVLDLHRVTEHQVKRAEAQAAKEWFQAQAR
jgi:hypothetical protein